MYDRAKFRAALTHLAFRLGDDSVFFTICTESSLNFKICSVQPCCHREYEL